MKIVLQPVKFLAASSLGANFDSGAFEIDAYFGFSVHYIVSSASALNGQLTVQVSPDKSTWVALPTDAALAVNPTTITANGSSLLTYARPMPYKYMRISYVRTAGTGSLDVWFTGMRV